MDLSLEDGVSPSSNVRGRTEKRSARVSQSKTGESPWGGHPVTGKESPDWLRSSGEDVWRRKIIGVVKGKQESRNVILDEGPQGEEIGKPKFKKLSITWLSNIIQEKQLYGTHPRQKDRPGLYRYVLVFRVSSSCWTR